MSIENVRAASARGLLILGFKDDYDFTTLMTCMAMISEQEKPIINDAIFVWGHNLADTSLAMESILAQCQPYGPETALVTFGFNDDSPEDWTPNPSLNDSSITREIFRGDFYNARDYCFVNIARNRAIPFANSNEGVQSFWDKVEAKIGEDATNSVHSVCALTALRRRKTPAFIFTDMEDIPVSEFSLDEISPAGSFAVNEIADISELLLNMEALMVCAQNILDEANNALQRAKDGADEQAMLNLADNRPDKSWEEQKEFTLEFIGQQYEFPEAVREAAAKVMDYLGEALKGASDVEIAEAFEKVYDNTGPMATAKDDNE